MGFDLVEYEREHDISHKAKLDKPWFDLYNIAPGKSDFLAGWIGCSYNLQFRREFL